MSAHTPGPWCMGISDRRVSMVSVHAANMTATHSMIARMALPVKGGMTYNEIEANARLIAAAPDLLEAVKLAVTALRALGADEVDGALLQCRAAIYNATGGTP